jgi:hypothetical protein
MERVMSDKTIKILAGVAVFVFFIYFLDVAMSDEVLEKGVVSSKQYRAASTTYVTNIDSNGVSHVSPQYNPERFTVAVETREGMIKCSTYERQYSKLKKGVVLDVRYGKGWLSGNLYCKSIEIKV